MEKTPENVKWATEKISGLETLKFCPKTKPGVAAVVDQFLSMVPSVEIGEWLIAKILRTEEEFPPPARMRSILSYTYRPADDPKRPDEK